MKLIKKQHSNYSFQKYTDTSHLKVFRIMFQTSHVLRLNYLYILDNPGVLGSQESTSSGASMRSTTTTDANRMKRIRSHYYDDYDYYEHSGDVLNTSSSTTEVLGKDGNNID